MRIISGKFKGFKLNKPSNYNIRPTSDRFKETLFSIIFSSKFNEDFIGKNFLDICSGSGNIGLEAFSRGANKVYMIDWGEDSINLIKKNIYRLKLRNQLNKNIFTIQNDFRKIDKLNLPRFDFVFFDPPYKSYLYVDFLKNAERSNLFDEKTAIFVETNVEIDVTQLKLKVVFFRKISKSYLYCFKLH